MKNNFKSVRLVFFISLVGLMIFSSVFFMSCKEPAGNSITGSSLKPVPVSTFDPGTPSPAVTNLLGAGATFPQPLYTKWFNEYYKITGVKINYQGVGSGTGIQQITLGNVDFGASDAIMTAEQESAAEKAFGPVLHIPMTSGATAIIFNLPGISSGQLKLTGEVLADIYLRKILKWNDPQIAALNPDLKLPDSSIAPVHRSDGSGTTFIFTNYLCKVSSEWANKIGNGTSVSWPGPGDIGGNGSAGVAGQVKQVPNSIGYVEMSYAVQNNIPWAKIKNRSGLFKEPSLEGTTRAAEGIELPDDMKIMITNSPNQDAYPVSGFTWILCFVNQKEQAKGSTLANMLWWALHDGQRYAADLTYGPLSESVVKIAEKQILSINYQGTPFIVR